MTSDWTIYAKELLGRVGCAGWGSCPEACIPIHLQHIYFHLVISNFVHTHSFHRARRSNCKWSQSSQVPGSKSSQYLQLCSHVLALAGDKLISSSASWSACSQHPRPCARPSILPLPTTSPLPNPIILKSDLSSQHGALLIQPRARPLN